MALCQVPLQVYSSRSLELFIIDIIELLASSPPFDEQTTDVWYGIPPPAGMTMPGMPPYPYPYAMPPGGVVPMPYDQSGAQYWMQPTDQQQQQQQQHRTRVSPRGSGRGSGQGRGNISSDR